MNEEEKRFRDIFHAAHADHLSCAHDEWLHGACSDATGPVDRPIVWSRRNGPWHRVPILFVGAAPGNAGGLGSSDLGAHGTRIPFGGDIAGGNLDVMLSSIGITRNDTFLAAAYNQLPAKGGGEPTAAELASPIGRYPDSIALLRDTIIATGPSLIVALGNVALRSIAAALTREYDVPVGDPVDLHAPPRLPSLKRLADAGLVRDHAIEWPDDQQPVSQSFRAGWQAAWRAPLKLSVIQLLHPSAQNMSAYAGTTTLFHTRMLDTLAALGRAAHDVLGLDGPARRPGPPKDGIYALPEWRERIAERQARYDELWRQRGV